MRDIVKEINEKLDEIEARFESVTRKRMTTI